MALDDEEAAAAAAVPAAAAAPRREPPGCLRGGPVVAGTGRAGETGIGLTLPPPPLPPCPDRRSAEALPVGIRGPLRKVVMLLGVLLVLCQRVQAEKGVEQQKLIVAPSSEPFTNWRAILSPTWPSRELESSSVGDISMRQALDNANLLQIIKSTLAGTRTRTMDQTKFLPSLYQGSGNSASQEPSEVSTEPPVRSQDADEMTIVSGLPQLSVSSALSTSPSVTHSATVMSSQIMPYTTSFISKEITPGSDILPNPSSPSPLPLVKKSPHIIIVSKLTVPSSKVPLSTDSEKSLTTNISNLGNSYTVSGNSLRKVTAGNFSTIEYSLPRKGGKELLAVTPFRNNFRLNGRSSTIPAAKHIHADNMKLHPPPLHAVTNQTSLLLSTQRVPLNFSKISFFSGIIQKTPSIAVFPSQLPDTITHHKEGNIYAATPVPKNQKASWISVLALSASHVPATQVSPVTDVSSLLSSNFTKKRAVLLASERPQHFHLMRDVSSPTVPSIFISKAMNMNNAKSPIPASPSIPAFYSMDKVTSLIAGRHETYATSDVTILSSNRVASELHLTKPYITKFSKWVFTKDTSNRVYENSETTSSTVYEQLTRLLQRQSFTKDTTATTFTNAKDKSFLPYQLSGPQTFALEIPVSKQTAWRTGLEKFLSQERTSPTTFSVSLPTSLRSLLKFHSPSMFISPSKEPSYSKFIDSSLQTSAHNLTEEDEGKVKVSTTGLHTEHLSHTSLNKSDVEMHEMSHLADTTSKTTAAPSYEYVAPSLTPAMEYWKSPVPTSEAILDASKTGETPGLFEWDGENQQSSTITIQTSSATKDYTTLTALRAIYSELPDQQQQTDYKNKKVPSSLTTPLVNTFLTSLWNISASTLMGTRSKRSTGFNTHGYSVESSFDQHSSFPQNQTAFSQDTELPSLQSKDTYTPVLPSVSPGVIPSVATSEATPVTGKSAPTSPMLTSSLFSLSTENSPSVMALSTLISTLAKSDIAIKMVSTLSPVVTHAAIPVVPQDESATSVYTTSSIPSTKNSTVSVPTTHAPSQHETTVLDTKKPTTSDITKTSTAYPLTITAALTSITASAKTARLLPTPAENTSVAATTPVSTAVFANVTAVLPFECQLSRILLVRTVLFLNTRRLQQSDSLKENVTKGLTQALRQAFNQNVNAQIEILEQSNNVTVGYYVTHERLVFIPAVVIEMLIAYGVSNATLDIKQHVPNLHSVAVLALPWDPLPAYHFQLKTELQFVGQADNIQSCRFVQTMEQRLQKAFQDAERKVLNSSSKLTVQILNTSNVSQAVTLFYVVKNESTVLNGTVSSNLLNHLSAELVGFYLTYPPLTIAEALEYPNLDTSEATRDYWVITVIQGVDFTLLGVNNQSFARLMEQRLAPLFMMSHQQGRRFKRATTIGSYTVQMVKMQRIPGPKEPAELTYYTLYNGKPLLGTTAAKILSTVDSQRMALTLGYVVQIQADPVVKNPPNNLWIIAAVLAPIAVVTVIIIIITAVLCRKNKNDFKADTMMNLPQRAKPVQGFDYAKQHLGQQGAEDEVLPVTQETVVLPLPVRDAPASHEREIIQDGSIAKTAKSNDTRKSRSPSENGSVISNESGKPNSGRGSPQKVMAQQKVTKEEGRKRNVPISDEEEGDMLFDNVAKSAIDPFDTSSGSVQLIAIKPVALPPVHPASDRNQENAILNGEVNKALKQKSDIEHYRNKLRLKAKRKGYYDFPQVDNNKGLSERKKVYEKAQNEIDHILDPDTDGSSPFVEPKNRQQMKNSIYRSRQSLNSPSPGETEMDLLVTRERQRRGIRNSGYDTEPEMIEETNVDRVNEPRNYTRSHQAKGHSETSTLSSQPSIDEVRQQMHMLLEEAFSLASAGHGGQSRQQDAYSSTQHLPYSEVVTSAPGTMSRPRGGIQWVPTYRPEMYQYSLPRPAYRFSPLPEMVMGSPPPPVPPRTGPVAVTSLRRSTSDIGSKTRISESSGTEQIQPHEHAPFVPVSRAPVSVAPLDQSALNYSGSTVPAVFAIPAANRQGFTGYFIPAPPTAYRNQAWLSYAGENELPGQWADSVPLPGYIEAYSRPRYQHNNSPSRLPRQYNQPSNLHPSLDQVQLSSTAASQQSLTENYPLDNPLTSLSTAALVKAIREEVAKLAKKQTDMFEFQV
uniref:KIAA1549 like n=1 Tax=Salvator merianae TaxID=96440 RepID=A0A8D0BAH9_SALMN